MNRYRHSVILLLAAFAVRALLSPCVRGETSTSRYVAGQVIVRFEKSTSLAEAKRALQGTTFNVREAIVPSRSIFLVGLDAPTTVSEAISRLKQNPLVRWVQADHWLSLRTTTPDDPQFASQWNLDQVSGADVSAPEAWDLATGGDDPGGNDIVVAIVDNGSSVTHLDLAPNLWVNAGEIPANSIDDDGNGYVDDINGWDAYNNDGSIPLPGNSHGTHVAGIVGARGNNTRQVAGVNWDVKLMIVAASSSSTSTVSRGYNYVLTQKERWLSSGGTTGANVVATNSSFGVNYGDCASDSFPIWNDLYNALGEAGILSAAATANLSLDVDVQGDIPTSCSSPYLISVTNTTSSDQRNAGAAWGDTTIDLGAPGTSILNVINTGTSVKTGTSMASPHAAGAVALLHAAASPDFYVYYLAHPDSAALLIKQMMLDSVDLLPGFDTLTVSGGRLDLYRAAAAIHAFVGPAPSEPYLVYVDYAAEDFGTGDGDSVLEAGETARIVVTLSNFGAEAANVNGTLSSSDPYIAIGDSTGSFGTIPADSSGGNSSDPFELTADSSTPLEHGAPLTLTLTADGPYGAVRCFTLTVGEGYIYFTDSVESGANGWTHSSILPGFTDAWHLSTESYAGPTHSWKCGDAGAGTYANRLDAGLVSPPVTITPYSTLYFSHWMDSEVPFSYPDSAYDGGIIEVSANDSPFVQVTPSGGYPKTFRTIRNGSGYTGPLPGKPCFAGTIYWAQRRVDLTAYVGQTVRIRFRFGSDSVTAAEGWYVDDIFIRGQEPYRAPPESVNDLVIVPDGDDIRLFWSPPPSGADHYVIYRNAAAEFVPAPADSIGWTADTTFVDFGVILVLPESFYQIKVVGP